MSEQGLITSIQRFSTLDGPGVRTTVFLKGCPLRCYWCHNPETQSGQPQLQFFASRCIGCGTCGEVCPQAKEGRCAVFAPECTVCGKCAASCCAGALQIVGEERTSERLAEELLRDREMFAVSGGGVTFSGGEPFAQSDFLLDCLKRCKEGGLHIAAETALAVPYEAVEKCLPYIDLFLCDIKMMDPQRHKAGTGLTNTRILENIRRLSEQTEHILFRTPVIPGFNDTIEDIESICSFVASLGGKYRLELLEFHNWCSGKYTSLNRKYEAEGRSVPKEQFERLRTRVEQKGVLYCE